MSIYSQHKKAAILSYINLALTNIGGIVITPFIIKSLGDSQYGLYTLIGAFVGYLSVLDLGLNNAITRFVSQYRIQRDQVGEENFLAISFIVYLCISLLIILIGGGLYLNLDCIFGQSLSPTELKQAKLMSLILIANLAITIPGGAFAGICSGYERFVFPRLMSIIKYLLRIVLVVVILKYGSDALGLVILDSILNIAFILFTAYYTLFRLKVKVKLHEYNFKYVKEIFSYSIWLFIYALTYQFQWRTGQVILGITTNTITVAVYGVGVMLGVYFTIFGNVVNGLILPRAVQSVYNDYSNEQITNQMIKIGRLLMVILLFVLGGYIILGRDFIYLWLGNNYQQAWIISLCIMAVYVIPTAEGYAHSVLEAKKKLKFKSISFFLSCIFGVVLGYILSFKLGALGMIFGLTFSMLIFQIIINIYYQKVIGLNIILFMKKAVLPYVFPFIMIISTDYFVNRFFSNLSWFTFVLKGIIYSLIYVCVIYFVLTKEERLFLIKTK